MSVIYSVQCMVDGRQIPTFLLDSDIQGITSNEHAKAIAHDIVDPLRKANEIYVYVGYTNKPYL